MSPTDTAAETAHPESPAPEAETGPDLPARAFDRMVRGSDAHRQQLRGTLHRMGLTGRDKRLLVLGCGSGAPVQEAVEEAPGWSVVAVDESTELAGIARRKNWPRDYLFLHATLGTLDPALREARLSGPFDAVLVVFQMRHQRNLDHTLAYLADLLAPGAPLAVHEYSVRGSRRSRARWTALCWLDYLPRIRVHGRVRGMAAFLWRSVLRFDSAEEFKERLALAGLTDVRAQTFPGSQEQVLFTFLARKRVPEPEDVVDALAPGRAVPAARRGPAPLPPAPVVAEPRPEPVRDEFELEGDEEGAAIPAAHPPAAPHADPEAVTPPTGIPVGRAPSPGPRVLPPPAPEPAAAAEPAPAPADPPPAESVDQPAPEPVRASEPAAERAVPLTPAPRRAPEDETGPAPEARIPEQAGAPAVEEPVADEVRAEPGRPRDRFLGRFRGPKPETGRPAAPDHWLPRAERERAAREDDPKS